MKPFAFIGWTVVLLLSGLSSIYAADSHFRKGEEADSVRTGTVGWTETPVSFVRSDTAFVLVKTNLLYDALLMPSLEFEFRLNDRWSLLLEGDMAWWKRPSRHRYYQVATVSPEVRYWFKKRDAWHGHYVGAFGAFTWYDLENGEEGYKGEAILGGLTYGYMFPIGRYLSLDAGIGIGFLTSEYEEYIPFEGHYVYQQTERFNYFGPLKLKLALTWRVPWRKVKQPKGGAR